ncbi:MAG TPA: TolC family protein [Pyrinomonadaceae bacterium]|nr:TolC family protein [Pyrinomonadaceae bacterium]
MIFVVIFSILLSPLAAFAQQTSGANQGTGQNQGAQSGSGQNEAGRPARVPTQQGQPTAGANAQTSTPNQGGLSTQGGLFGGPPAPARTATQVGGQPLPGAARVTNAPSALSLEEAIQIAIKNNLATLLAEERQREAQGLAHQSRAGLLPQLSGSAYQANLTQNIAALGFQPGTFPGITNTFIGPFNNFDARARLVQSIFSLSAIRNYQAGREGVRVAVLQEGLAREQVATATALTYLEALRSDRSVAAAQANVDLAQTLLTLAQDQRNAGVATGVDVTRAQTRLAQEQVRLAEAQTSSEQSRLNLQRVVGLPLGSQLTLTDTLRFKDEPLPPIESAVTQAGEQRPEVRIAEAEATLAGFERRAARADLYPSLDFVGDYGVSGITPTNTDLPTRRVAVQLNVPIFNGGLTRGRIEVASSRERQAELELGSVRGQVEEDVRLSFATLGTTAAQVRAADQTVTLAERELEMSRDRFRNGVADNVEVVTAQAALSNARDAQVTALVQYNAARLNLAAALGRAESFRW